MDRQRQHAGHGAEPERDHEQQCKYQLRNSAAEFEETAADDAYPIALLEVRAGEETQQEGARDAHERTDIGDQQGVEQEAQPTLDVPEPLRDVGAERLPRQCGSEIPDISRQAIDIGEEFLQVDFAGNARQHQRRRQDCEVQCGACALGGDGGAIVCERAVELLGRKADDGRGHCDRGGPSPAPSRCYDPRFFLRSSSTNLTTSMTGSYSWCVTGWNGSCLPS